LQQIVDLQNDPDFQTLDVAVLSIAADSLDELANARSEYEITSIPMLSDPNKEVAEEYGVLEWAVATGEPGHTFVLVDREGDIAWIQDYGAPENRGVMYVPVEELAAEVQAHLSR
jgi:peroxiredoxin